MRLWGPAKAAKKVKEENDERLKRLSWPIKAASRIQTPPLLTELVIGLVLPYRYASPKP